MFFPKVVFLDWYGTLSTSKFWEHWKDEPGERGQKFAHIQRLWLHEWNGMISEWCRGAYTIEEVVGRFSREIGVTEEMLMEELLVSFQHTRFVDPSIPELVGRLREQGVVVGIATDNVDVLERWVAPIMGLHDMFDVILNSYHLKALKGDVDAEGRNAFFRGYLAQSGFRGEEVMLIDDSHSAIEAVRREGIDYRLVPFGNGLTEELSSLLNGEISRLS